MYRYQPPDLFWTTTNVGEAAPGVQSPLSFSTWSRATRDGVNAAGVAIGVFREGDVYAGEVMAPFYGRAGMSVDFLRQFGDRMPGASGEQVVSGFIGRVPAGMTFTPTRRYYLNVLRRYPTAVGARGRADQAARRGQTSDAPGLRWSSRQRAPAG
jgi:pyruvate,water dikinase